jgi:DNA-binding NtrC family response regulator
MRHTDAFTAGTNVATMRGTMSLGRILIVDDEVNARTALAELLAKAGYAVETAADGFKALGKMDEFEPDLVLTDLRMPGLSGVELMAKVRERDPDCVVVVMTAHGAIETARRRRRLPHEADQLRGADARPSERDRA